MLRYLWVCMLFLLAICIHLALSSYEPAGSFWSNPATREEADKYFTRYGIKTKPRTVQDDITVNGTVRRERRSPRSQPPRRNPRRPSGMAPRVSRMRISRRSTAGTPRVSRMRNQRYGGSAYSSGSTSGTTRSSSTVTATFDDLTPRAQFKLLTGDLFDKNKFTEKRQNDDVKLAAPVADRTDIIFKGKTRSALSLPGTDMTFTGEFARLGDSDATTFKDVEISMVGTLNVHVGRRRASKRSGGVQISWDVEIHKPAEKEEYEILQFLPAQKVADLSQLFKNVINVINQFTDGKIDTSLLDLINGQSQTVTATGSFSKSQSELIITANGDNELTKRIGATEIHLIRTYEQNANNRFSILVSYDALGKLASWIGQEDLFTNNEWLNGITGKTCLFLVSGPITYLDATKTTLQDCFGAQTLEAEKETFQTLETGLHGYLMVDFSGVLDKCWEDPTTGEARSDKPTDEIESMHKEINLYGKIAKDAKTGKWRMAIKFLNELKMSVKAFKGCIAGVARNMPAFLSENRVVLKHLSKNGDNIFDIQFEVVANEDPAKKFFIPFTQIELSSLDFSANNNPAEDAPSSATPTWTFEGSIALVFLGSDISVKFHHSQEKTEVTIASTNLRIGDVIKAFDIPLEDDSVLNTMGVSNFNLEMSFESRDGGGRDFSVKIRGTPVFADWDSLHLSAIFIKKDGTLNFAVGLYLNGADFTPIMKNIFKRDDISMSWLANLQVVVVFNKLDSDVKLVDAGSLEESEEESEGESGEGSDEEGGKKKLQKDAKSMSEKDKRGKRKSGKIKSGKRKSGKTKSGKRKSRKSGKQVRNIVATKEVIGKIQIGTNVTKVLATGQNITAQPTVREGETDGEGDGDADEGPQLAFQDLAASTLAGESKGPGIHLTISWTLPTAVESCSGSTLCTWMVDYLVKDPAEPPVASISASFDGSSFSLAASFNGKYNIKQYLDFTGIKLEFAVGVETKLELSATLEYADPELTPDGKLVLTGAIQATPGSLMLEFSMEGLVRVSDFVEIGNVKLGGGISAGMPAFLFGITINLGHKDGDLIKIRGDVRVDLANPAKNFIFARINALTVERVCEAFKFDCTHVIDPIMKTGFPNGVTFSFAPKGVDDLGSEYGDIPQGLFIEGTFNIFGFESYTKLVVSTGGFELDIRLGPINWAYGMIQLYKEQGNTQEGPIGKAKLSSDAPFEFKIQSYGRILWIIWKEVDIEVTSTNIKFHVGGTIIPGILEGELHLDAALSPGANSNDNPLFGLMVRINTGKLNVYIKVIVEKIVGALRVVVQTLKRGIDAILSAAQSAYNAIDTKHKEWEKDVKAWGARLEARKEELSKKSEVTCNCKQVCLPFLDWKSKCWKVWGYWVGCPFWNSCFTKIKDPICYMGCVLTQLKQTIKKWANQAVLAIERLVLSGVEGLLSLLGKVLDFAERALKSAEEFKERTYKKIPEILRMEKADFDSNLYTFGIRTLELSASLSATYKACVGYKYNVEWFGSTYEGEGEACLDIVQFVRMLLNSIMEGNSKSRGTSKASEVINEAEKEKGEHQKSVDDVNQKTAKADEKVAADVGAGLSAVPAERRDDIPTLKRIASKFENVPRASIAPTKKEMELIQLSEQKIEKYDVKGDPYVRSITDESPWQLPNQKHAVGYNETIQRDDDAIEKRTLHFDSQLTSCGRIKRALDGYSQLTNGLLEYTNAVEKTSQDMQQTKINNNNKLQKFRRDVETTVSHHNMSGPDAADAYYLYHKLADRHDELEKRSNIAVQREDAYAIPLIRRHINDLLSRETGSTFMKYTEVMHHNAVQGYKRSIIPTPNDVQGEQILGSIKKELQSIVSNENSRLTPMRPRLIAIKRNIITMSEITKKCRQN